MCTEEDTVDGGDSQGNSSMEVPVLIADAEEHDAAEYRHDDTDAEEDDLDHAKHKPHEHESGIATPVQQKKIKKITDH